jgi:hypothetical protein
LVRKYGSHVHQGEGNPNQSLTLLTAVPLNYV